MVGWLSLERVSDVDNDIETVGVAVELALLRQSINTVIEQHGKEIAESKTLHVAADSKRQVDAIQLNAHELRLSSLELKTSGLFNRAWTITTGCVSLIALMFTWIKMGSTP